MTDEEYGDHVTRLRSTLDGIPESAYTHNHYTPERRTAHQNILDEAWSELGGDDIPRSRQGLILAGLPGSMKTTVRNQGAVPGIGPVREHFLPIDSDYFKTKIIDAGLAPSLRGFSPMETAPLIHKESNDLAKMLAKRAYSQGTNMAWDYTLRHPHSGPNRLAEFDKFGYTPHGIYTHVDPDEALRRVSQRHRTDLDAYLTGNHRHGGRYVPPEIITDSVKGGRIANRDNYDKIAPRLATSQVIDTTGPSPFRTAEFSSQPLNITNDYSMAAFFQWCAHNRKQPTPNDLAEFAVVSGMNAEDYIDNYLFLSKGS